MIFKDLERELLDKTLAHRLVSIVRGVGSTICSHWLNKRIQIRLDSAPSLPDSETNMSADLNQLIAMLSMT